MKESATAMKNSMRFRANDIAIDPLNTLVHFLKKLDIDELLR